VRRVVELALIPKLAGARLHEEAAVRLARAHGGHAVRIAVVRDRGARCVLDRTVDLPTLLSDCSFAVNRVVVPAKEYGGKGRGKAKAKGNNGGRCGEGLRGRVSKLCFPGPKKGQLTNESRWTAVGDRA
jgi:hypothetical protein